MNISIRKFYEGSDGSHWPSSPEQPTLPEGELQWVHDLLDAAIDFQAYQSIRHNEILKKAIEVANVKINEPKFSNNGK